MQSLTTPASAHILGIRAAHAALHDRLTTPDASIPLPSPLDETQCNVTSLLQASLTDPNTSALSVLLIGPSGSGKSLLLSHVLSTLSSRQIQPKLVELHGLLHNTASSAWRAIAAQLDSEPPTSQTECLAVIDRAMKELRQSQTPFLLVLDMFDRFVNTDPLTQNVLYALFNLIQDTSLRAACVAMTTCVDVADGLEKRVKSRFAAREVIVPLPADADQVLSFVEQCVIAGDDDDEERGDVMDEDDAREEFDRGISDYNEVARLIVQHERCRRLVAKYLSRSRVIVPVLQALDAGLAFAFADELLVTDEDDGEALGVVEVDSNEERVEAALKQMEIHLFPPNPLVEMMENLTSVELALLVALRKLFKKERVNFGDVFKEYGTLRRAGEGFAAAEDGEATVALDVAEKCWQRLIEGGLVLRTGHGPRFMRTVALGVEPYEVDRVLQRHRGVSTRLQRWARGGRG